MNKDEQLAAAKALQKEFKSSGSNRGDHTFGGRGGGRGGRGGGGRGGYQNVALDYGPSPSRGSQPSSLSGRPHPGLPRGSRHPSTARQFQSTARVPAAPMFAPSPIFASAFGATPSTPAQALDKGPVQSAATLTHDELRDQFTAMIDTPKASGRVPSMTPAKVAAQAASNTTVQTTPKVPALVAAQNATKALIQATPKDPALVAPKDNEQEERRARITVATRIATLNATKVTVQAAANVSAQFPSNAPVQVCIEPPTKAPPTLASASTNNRGSLKPPAARSVRQVTEQPTNFSETHEKPVSRPGNDGGSTTQDTPPLADGYIDNTSSMIGNQPGPRSAESPHPITTSRNNMTDGLFKGYYQNENIRPVVKLPVSSNGTMVRKLQQQPHRPTDAPVKEYFQAKPHNLEVRISAPPPAPVAPSNALVIAYHQDEPPQAKRNINTPAAPNDGPVIAYYQDESYDAKPTTSISMASNDAPVIEYYQDEPLQPKRNINTTAASVDPPIIAYYQDELFHPMTKTNAPGAPVAPVAPVAPTDAPVIPYYQDVPTLKPKPKINIPAASSETPVIAFYQDDPPRVNTDPCADMMDTTPDKPRKITANQGDNLQSEVGQNSVTNSQPIIRGAASDADDLMDLNEDTAITGYPVLATADTQQATGGRYTCPKKAAVGLGTSRWAAPAVKEADPISVTCPVHRPNIRITILTPTTPSFSPISSSFSPTASCFFPQSETTRISPGRSPAASAPASVRGQSTEKALNGHSNGGTSGPVGGPPSSDMPWFL